jgi:uncharacterized protein (DUF2147 family)
MYNLVPELLMFALASAGVVAATGPQDANLHGRWRTQMHGALVEMKNCSDRSPCAFLAWVDPAKARGVTRDERNPNPALRSRPLVGTPILWGLKRSDSGWNGGRVYNPETGQTFRSAMQRMSDNRLKVTGCWGPLCRSEIWTRVP